MIILKQFRIQKNGTLLRRFWFVKLHKDEIKINSFLKWLYGAN